MRVLKMDADCLREFERHVRQIVMPLSAGPLRKKQMRAELVAHLWASYQEALTEGGEDAACAAAKARLGAAQELSGDLQASVPWLESALFRIISLKEHTMSRWYGFAIGAVAAICWGLLLPGQGEIAVGALIMLAAVALVQFSQEQNRSARWLRGNWAWLAGVFGLLFGPAIIMPALGQFFHEHKALVEVAGPLVIGACITLIGLGLLGRQLHRKLNAA